MKRIDAATAAANPKAAEKAYSSAYRGASKAADWLSLLKRARGSEFAGDRGRFIGTARRAVKAEPTSEPVAVAAAYAMLRGGDPASALALFKMPLSPDSRPTLWAECFIAAAKAGSLASTRPGAEDFARLASATGAVAPYSGAAALALSRGERALAATYASKAIETGADLSANLLWDCGLRAELAGMSDSGASAIDLATMGDAAWSTGDAVLAKARWEAAIAADPRTSWKPYAKLALSSGEGQLSESMLSRMKAAFIKVASPSTEAAVAYAAMLSSRGRDQEAAALLAPFPGEAKAAALGLRVKGASWPEDRLVAEATRFAASGLPDAEGYGLALIAGLGRANDLVALLESIEATGRDYPDRWFYTAAARIARGRYAEAVAAIEGGGDEGPEASLALGIAYGAMGDFAKAAPALKAASDSFGEPKARCRALKELGANAARAGDSAGAAEAYRAAAAADPADSEAAMLARGREL